MLKSYRNQKKRLISIVVPVRNELPNLNDLISRIDRSFTLNEQDYEMIFVDDYSDDGSAEFLSTVARVYPIRIVKKRGIIGKGASIVEGLEEANGSIIAVLDADLSYPPEEILPMVEKLHTHDIVVATRTYLNGERKIKKILSKLSQFLFGKIAFGLDYDIQSGLKVFKKEVIESITLNPSRWSFSLEFLYKSSEAGYRITSHNLKYGSRKRGKRKMNPFFAFIELCVLTIRYRLFAAEPVFVGSHAPDHSLEVAWKTRRFKPYTKLKLENSAIRTLSSHQIILMLMITTMIIGLLIINWRATLIAALSIVTTLYFADLLFSLLLIVRSLKKSPELQIPPENLKKQREWPSYSILCPLYREWQVIPQFVKAMQQLDYPVNRVEVLLVLEEDDEKTQEEVKKMQLPKNFRVIITPHTYPKTKPKACNYALLQASGEYVVIYDAEDIPDPQQLKKAVLTFEEYDDERIVCLQAKLNFYNSSQNILTRLFTLEYSLWFDLILPGLHAIGAPIPLGGTSNHFRKHHLTLLQGWDPFNVTEDCDLGIRLFKYGYQTKILDSVTMEEANSSFFGWFPQRTRWMKGYIQTYLVHMRRPHDFINDWSNLHLFTFQLVVGGKILSTLINPFLWSLTIIYFLFRSQAGTFIESLFLDPIYYIGVISLVVGNFLYFYYYMIGAAKRGYWSLVKYAFLVPFYWIMMSYASWRALKQIILKPHYWEKTKHGLHLSNALA